jgi:hypothetical protein
MLAFRHDFAVTLYGDTLAGKAQVLKQPMDVHAFGSWRISPLILISIIRRFYQAPRLCCRGLGGFHVLAR